MSGEGVIFTVEFHVVTEEGCLVDKIKILTMWDRGGLFFRNSSRTVAIAATSFWASRMNSSLLKLALRGGPPRHRSS